MSVDVSADLYETEGHPMTLMREMGMKCESLASVPLVDSWWIFGAEWEGDLPKGFSVNDLLSQRDSPYYQKGKFTEGLGGTTKPLPSDLIIDGI